MRARTAWWGAAVVFVGVAAWSFRPRSLAVELGTADTGAVRSELTGEGMTRASDGTHQELSAPFTGAWNPARIEVGDRVAKGAPLGTLAPLPLDGAAAVAAAERVRGAEAAWRDRRDAAARGARLHEAGALSAEELQHLRTAEVAAEAEWRAARAQLGPGQRINVRAPLAGRLLRWAEPHPRTVGAGALLAEVGDPSALDVVVDLRTEDAGVVRPGTRAVLRTSAGGAGIAATVRSIEPRAFTEVSPLGVEEQRVNVVLGFDRPPQGLGVGWRVEAVLEAAEVEGVVRVPVAALVRQPEGWAVWVVEEGRARRRGLVLGVMGDEVAEVRSGIGAGVTVILRPTDAVAEGVRVRGTAQ